MTTVWASAQITAGGAAFVAGDQFLLTVGPGNGAYKLCNANAVDGSQDPTAKPGAM